LKRLQEDIDFLDHELLRLFRQRDFEASLNQNRYRLFQIRFMLLAAIATVIGALQGLALGNNNALVPWLAFAETVVALVVTYQATISGRESPLPLWLQNRRRAEYLRREYFRYLMDLPPYDTVEGYERKLLLSTRAANINRGIYPDQQSE
jgi:heme exporter protein D